MLSFKTGTMIKKTNEKERKKTKVKEDKKALNSMYDP